MGSCWIIWVIKLQLQGENVVVVGNECSERVLCMTSTFVKTFSLTFWHWTRLFLNTVLTLKLLMLNGLYL